jgi:hypothetical protein
MLTYASVPFKCENMHYPMWPDVQYTLIAGISLVDFMWSSGMVV